MALASTDPRVLMGQAKCFSCLSPKLQYQLRTYLLAKIAMGDTSITGVQALSVASTCFSCFTHGELLAAKQYLMAVWLGLDTTKTGIIAQAATAACDYACLTPVQAEQVRTYLLAVTAGVATDAAGVQALELAAKCFECPTNKRQLEMQVYLLSTLAPGAPTTASAIMQAAGCFLACVPPELHEAFQTSLFAQVANRSTPPCVTPTAPGQPSVFSALNNILKISWTQPANSGSLIQSYTVSYGTTQGGPYTATKTVQAGTKQAVLNGLNAGTTYFFVVVANSFTGCSSANSAEGSASTTGTPPLDPVVTSWSTQVQNNGGAVPSTPTLNGLSTFVSTIKNAGFWNKMIAIMPLVPDSFIAGTTPLIQIPAGNNPWTNHNFVNADLTINGLKGDGASKYLDAGFTDQDAFGAINPNYGITCYFVENINSAGYCGTVITGDHLSGLLLRQNNAGNAYFFSYDVNINAATIGAGYYSGNRPDNAHTNLYAASSTSPHASIASSNQANNHGITALKVFLCAVNDVGAPLAGLYESRRLSFFALHFSLTSTESQTFFNAIQALRTTLGGGFV